MSLKLVKVLYIQPGVDEKESATVLEKILNQNSKGLVFAVIVTSSSFRGLEYIEDIPFDAIILHQDVSGLTPRDMTYDGPKNGFNGVIPFPYTPLEFASTLRPFLPIPQEDKHLMNNASSLDRSSISTEEPDGRSPVSIAHSHNGQSSNRDLTVDLEEDDGLADFLSDSLDCSSAFEQYSGDMAPASGLKRKRGVIA